MFCIKCGQPIEKGKTVCPKCGFENAALDEKQEEIHSAPKENENRAESKNESDGTAQNKEQQEASLSEEEITADRQSKMEVSDQDESLMKALPSIPEPETEDESESKNRKKSSLKKLLIVLAAALCLMLLWFAVRENEKANLRKSLMGEWYEHVETIVCILDFDEDTITYRVETGLSWLDSTLAIYDWEPVGSNQIRVRMHGTKSSQICTIDLNDNNTVMTISPSITSADSSKTWFSSSFY